MIDSGVNASEASSGNPPIDYQDVDPRDFLDAMKTLDISCAFCANQGHNWIDPQTYLDWSVKYFVAGGDSDLAASIVFAKRAVYSIIDRLMIGFHLEDYLKNKYDEKIKSLGKIGVAIPRMVKSYVVNPRNTEEHEYCRPTSEVAADAKETASMFLGFIKSQWGDRLKSKMVFATSVDDMKCFRNLFNTGEDEKLKFEGVLPEYFIFIYPHAAIFKLIHSSNRSGLLAKRKDFTLDDLKRFDELSVPKNKSRASKGKFLCGGWSTIGTKSADEIAKYMQLNAMI